MRKLQGTVSQTAADTSMFITRQTGALQSLFQAIKPRYLRFHLVNGTIGWGAGSILNVIGTGGQSGLKAIWSTSTQTSWVFNNVFEWFPPIDQPLLFDETFALSVTSLSGVINTVDYVFYYDVITSNELTMVQTIDGY